MLRVRLSGALVSPIGHLVPLIPDALANAAPERVEELNRWTRGMTVSIVEDAQLHCYSTQKKRAITVSTGVLELLWCQAYGSFVFYQKVVAGRQPTPGIQTIADPEVRAALELYRWALSRTRSGSADMWPSGLAQPSAARAYASNEHVADELTLLGVSFLLFHELGHLALEHAREVPNDVLIDQERDADNWATEWLLGAGGVTSPELRKRSLGVATAMMSLVATGIHTGWYDGVTHPKSYDRLWNALDRHLSRESRDAWAMVVALLGLHLTNKQMPVPVGPFDDFRDAVNAMIDALAATDATRVIRKSPGMPGA